MEPGKKPSTLSMDQLFSLEKRLKDAVGSIHGVVVEMQHSDLSGFFEEGINKLEEGITILQNKIKALTGLNVLLNNWGISDEEGFFGILPNETKLHIFSYLDYKDLAKLSLVCKQWNDNSLSLGEEPSNSNYHEGGLMDILWRDLFYDDFMESSAGDDGVIHRLGGPSAVKVTASSIWTGTPELFLAKEEGFCWTQNKPFSWFMVDFGENVLITPNRYIMKYASSGKECCPRNWMLQGAVTYDENLEDKEDPRKSTQWDAVSVHVNDKTINGPYEVGSFKIKGCAKGYRYFRILETGPNDYDAKGGPDDWSNVLVASGFELFGKITHLNQSRGTSEDDYATLMKPKERSWKWLYKTRNIKYNAKDIKNGPGTFNDGKATYIGDWKNNMKDGFGTYIETNGNTYKGWWKEDKRHGEGMSITEAENGGKIKYFGGWENGLFHGKGSYIWEMYGDRFEGEWVEGKKNGFGTFEWSEGDSYSGQWKDDLLHGEGIFKWAEGTYKGTFDSDDISGFGTLMLTDGTKYEGVWKGQNTYKKREGTSLLLHQLKRFAANPKNDKLIKKID